ncbi:hypothetical protein FRC02_010776 [Tulasnella sp. 418]|nr:hypothetical protein FRC02_010776 [Tulasnella sp. 418]
MRLSFTFATAILPSLISSVVIAHPTRVIDSRAEIQGAPPSLYQCATLFQRSSTHHACTSQWSDNHRGRIKATTSDGVTSYIKGGTNPPILALTTTTDLSEALQVSLIFDGISPLAFFRIETRDVRIYQNSPLPPAKATVVLTSYPPNLGATLLGPSNYALAPNNNQIAQASLVGTNPDSPNSPAEAKMVPTSYGDGIALLRV